MIADKSALPYNAHVPLRRSWIIYTFVQLLTRRVRVCDVESASPRDLYFAICLIGLRAIGRNALHEIRLSFQLHCDVAMIIPSCQAVVEESL